MFVSSRRLNLLNVNQLLLNQGGITSSYAITPGDYLASHWGHGDSRIHCLNLPVRGVIFGTPLQGGNPFTIPLGWQGLALFLEGAAGVIFYDCWFTGGCYAYYFRIASWEPHSGPEILSSHQPRNCEVFWGGGSLYYLYTSGLTVQPFFAGGRSGHDEVMAHCFAQVADDWWLERCWERRPNPNPFPLMNLLGKSNEIPRN